MEWIDIFTINVKLTNDKHIWISFNNSIVKTSGETKIIVVYAIMKKVYVFTKFQLM